MTKNEERKLIAATSETTRYRYCAPNGPSTEGREGFLPVLSTASLCPNHGNPPETESLFLPKMFTRHANSPIEVESKRIVTKLTALFSIDAFGGGFLTDALVAYWFFRRFGIGEEGLGALFFAVHILNAASHLGAAWLARHIGLVRTMVFTHLPSSLFLIAVPFAPSFKAAILLFLCREALVEMDVPTRQSYVAAVVLPY